MKKVEGIKKYKTATYKNSYEDVKYSTGNTVKSIIITMYVFKWVLDLSQ